MKKRNKGAISIFALLSMMFFLIFIMVAYNNVMQKGKTQVETQGILVDYYKKSQTASEITSSKIDSNKVSNDNSNLYLKENAEKEKITGNNGKFVFSNGKIYEIQYSE